MYRLTEIEMQLKAVTVDLEKFYNKGNTLASVRALRTLKEISRTIAELRKDVLNKKKNG